MSLDLEHYLLRSIVFHICIILAGVLDVAQVNKKIIVLFLYPFSPSIPLPSTPFSLAIPWLHLPLISQVCSSLTVHVY